MGCCLSKNKVSIAENDTSNIRVIKEDNKLKDSLNNEVIIEDVTDDISIGKVSEIRSNSSLKDLFKAEKTSIISLKDLNERNSASPSNKSFKQHEIISDKYEVEKWKIQIENLVNNKELNDFVLSKSRTDFKRYFEFKKYMKLSPAKNDLEKAWTIFKWIGHNIVYNMEGFLANDLGETDPESVFDSGTCVCAGYAALFKDVCDSLQIECIQISGYSKGFGYKTGDKLKKADHAWNAINLNGKWEYVESTWSAANKQEKAFNPYHFIVPAHIFLNNHYSEAYQYQKEKITLEQFENRICFTLDYYLLDFSSVISNMECQIKSKQSPYFVEFMAPKESKLTASLYNRTDELIENSVLVQRDSASLKYGIIVFLPKTNEYFKLKLFGCSQGANTSNLICDFDVIKIGTSQNHLPNYRLVFEHDIECLSHNSLFINTQHTPIFIELKIKKEIKIIANLFSMLDNQKVDNNKNTIIIQRDKHSFNYGLIVTLPEANINYKLSVYAKDTTIDHTNTNFNHVLNFFIKSSKEIVSFDFKKYALAFDHDIECLSHHTLVISTQQTPIFFEFIVKKEIEIIADLYTTFDNKIVDESKKAISIQRDMLNHNYGLFLNLPEANIQHKLNLYAKYMPSDKVFSHFANFYISSTNEVINYEFKKYTLGFRHGLKCISHDSLFIKTIAQLVFIEMEAPLETDIIAKMCDSNLVAINNKILIQRNVITHNLEINVIVPYQDAKYFLLISAKGNKNDTYYYQACEFTIINDTPIKQIAQLEFVQFFKNDLVTYIHEPLYSQLAVNKLHDFRVYVKDAFKVALCVNSEDWIHLEKDYDDQENIWVKGAYFRTTGKVILYVKKFGAQSFTGICEYKIS